MDGAHKDIQGSFRDPDGFLFCRDGIIYRQVNRAYQEHYDHLMNSGLYNDLLAQELLIPHEAVGVEEAEPDKAYKIIRPEPIPFISYTYEWCFSQLRDAALSTLKIQKKALDFGMSLKDSSAYNIQFRKCKPVLIDTLSFERYKKGKPWPAYRQFCRHFLAPLVLMSQRDARLNQLSRIYIDGIPLDLANSLIPFRARLKPSIFSHIELHAKVEKYFAGKSIKTKDYKIGRFALLGIIDNLEHAIKNLTWRAKDIEWDDYYEKTNYSEKAFQHKEKVVSEFLDKIKPKRVWDLGGNVGAFSRIAAKKAMLTVSFDGDPVCVERNYLECVRKGETNILPLLIDLTNPSPGIGWDNMERMSLSQRGPADATLALALIHHLSISNNLPFEKIAEFFNKICKFLIIEFVPKDDSQVQRLLLNREDIFPYYGKEAFEAGFGKHFTIQDSVNIIDSGRTLYLMEGKK